METCVGKKKVSKKSRAMDYLFLKEGVKLQIVSDFQKFHLPSTVEWYTTHGLFYRRNYLFYGPPGTGKTSMIRCLPRELRLSAYFLILTDQLETQGLVAALRQIPPNSMIVLEDVDALFNEERKSKSDQSPLTFSGLLNSLDGMLAKTGVVTVMTTNHIDRLDPALIRAGRVDRRFEFSYPSDEQLVELFKSYYPECDSVLSIAFAKHISEREEPSARSIASLL